MNFSKFLLIGAIAALLIGGVMYFTRTDYSDPVAVATAFTKAVKSNDMAKASKYVQPDMAEAWKTRAEAELEAMGSGQHERFFEGIPGDPQFGTPTSSPSGLTTITSSDSSLTLDLMQIENKWYVTRGPI